MSTRQRPLNLGELDRMTLSIYIALVAIGWLMIYAVNYSGKDPLAFLSLDHNAGKQLFFIVVCFVLLFFIFMMDWVFWRTFAFFIYVAALIFLVGTLFLGREINGANAWYQFGGFSFQPAEIAKFGTCLAVASFLSGTGVSLRDWKNRFAVFLIVLAPIFIILIQKDTGSGLVFLSFLLVFYREGLSSNLYLIGFAMAALVILGLVFSPVFVIAGLFLLAAVRFFSQFRENRPWFVVAFLLACLTIWWREVFTWFLQLSKIEPSTVQPNLDIYALLLPGIFMLSALLTSYFTTKNSLKLRRLQLDVLLLVVGSAIVFFANFVCFTVLAPHQQERIKVWLRPQECDPRGSLYNVLHSKMAIGSGGFSGKGFLEGNMTKLKYVPEQSTDFIFCTVGEEQGFIGVVGIVVLFTLLLYRLTQLAERQRSNFSRLYIYSVTGILFMHFLINVGMTMGIFPIIGIPLPFISYGGSSLIGFSLMMGVLLKLDSQRNQAG